MKPSWFRAMAVCAALALLPGRAACAAPPVAGAGFLAVAPVARGVPAAGEMAALDAAIRHYVQGRDALQTAPLEGFLAAHPASVYAVSLWFDIGRAHEQEGDYQAAAAAFRHAIAAAGPARALGYSPAGALVDQSFAELLTMATGFGDAGQMTALLADKRVTADGGALTTPMIDARRSLWVMRNRPQETFLCGAIALRELLAAQQPEAPGLAALTKLRSSHGGLSLADLQAAAAAAGKPVRAVKLAAGGDIPVPSVMHWRMGHYVAVLGIAGNRYLVADPAFNRQIFMRKSVLQADASGYYLVPAGERAVAGERLASAAEAAAIRGGGVTSGSDPSRTGGDSCSKGCPEFSVDMMLASLRLSDNPVGYHPPFGPDVEFQISYNEQDNSVSAVTGFGTPSFSNFGPQWSDNFMSYLSFDPIFPAGSAALLAEPGGGYQYYGSAVNYSYFNSDGSESFVSATPGSVYNSATSYAYAPEESDATVLRRVSATEFDRVFADGSMDVYSNFVNVSSGTTLVFLTKIVDHLGNALTLNYSPTNPQQLVSVTDAIGQTTGFGYGNTKFPMLITQVKDPFGRTAYFGYDTAGRLTQMTDAIGLNSSFTYSSTPALPATFITSMTTPYGTSSFNALIATDYPYWLTATDPMGNTERVEFNENFGYPSYSDTQVPNLVDNVSEFNAYLNSRDTFFWDKATYATIKDKQNLATQNAVLADYEKAVVYHWQHESQDTSMCSGVVESVLTPLERSTSNAAAVGRVWYAHPGDASTGFTGTLDLPSQIARLLPDGSTQLTQINYNALGNVTSRIDPVGRETGYTYAANGIDVTAITQSNAAGAGSQIGAFTYNGHHQPLTVTDAAGKTTTYTYNKFGQVLSVTNALGQTTNFSYNVKGYLTAIIGADGKTKESLTYDNVGRVASETDSQGYSVTSSYDNLDRLTKTGYPDGTSVAYKYTKLDVTSITDRLGRVTHLAYDADRNLIASTDPLGRTISYGYDPDGRLISLTDAADHTTKWTYDLEGRVTAKTFPDGTKVKYAYDEAGRMITRTDALGQATNYTYTTDDRVAGVSYTNAKNPTAPVSFAWDGTYPRIDSMTDGTGTTSYTYVAPGQNGALELASEAGPAGGIATYNYSYDAIGRANKLLAAGALLDSSSFDPIGRPMAEMTALGQFNIGYLGETAQVSSVTALGQVVAGASGLTSFGYLPNTGDRRLSSISYNAAPASNETLTTDDAGRVNMRTDGTGKSETYSYDAADRLVSGSVTGTSPAYTESYGYNNADVITSKSGEPVAADNFTATSTGSTNEISTLTPSGSTGRSFSYDADGEVLSDGVRKYTWDAENRLLTITEISSGHLTTFTYDGNGRRVGITETTGGSSTTTNYLWCGSVLCSAYAGGSTVALYPGFGEVRYSGGTATDYFYNTDHLGTVTSMTNAAGATVGTLATDAFGLTLSSSGTAPTFGYAGMFLHQPTSSIPPLYLTLNRVYDPYSGTWLSRDPSGEAGGLNLYGYVSESPTNGVDLIGLCGPLDNLLNFLSSIGGDAADAAGLALEVLATEILLGGPEDPIADFLVAEELAGDSGIDAVATDALAEDASEGIAESAEAGTTDADAAESADALADAPAEAEAPEAAESEGAGAADGAGDAAAEDEGAGAGGSCGCFAAATLVATPQGEVPITQIKVGDLVDSRDAQTGATAAEKVLRLIVHHHQVVEDVTLISAAGTEEITATPEHPFYVAGMGWVPAGALKAGERIEDFSGAALTVKSAVAKQAPQLMYNFEVANFHTYFVGKDQAWVHNSCGDSAKLGRNLRNSGTSQSANTVAHHIVASSARRAAPARAILQNAGIGINEPANGVFLSQSAHASLHTNIYYDAVNDALSGATAGTIRDVLSDIADQLLSGTFPH